MSDMPARILGYHRPIVGLQAVVAVMLASSALANAPAPESADSLARRVEERHRRAADLTARFTQTYRSGLLGREVVERGVLSLKRPGRMRWEYRDPEKKVFVSDGKTFYFYVPADKQVIVRSQADERNLPSMLLAGRGDLLNHFEVAREPTSSPSGARLRLVPRRADPEIGRLFLDVDQDARIRVIEVEDAQGNLSRFAFDDIRENVGLPDRIFEFEVPKGVEVVTG
jgi:outer membrane lipoprotein carrier protein